MRHTSRGTMKRNLKKIQIGQNINQAGTSGLQPIRCMADLSLVCTLHSLKIFHQNTPSSSPLFFPSPLFLDHSFLSLSLALLSLCLSFIMAKSYNCSLNFLVKSILTLEELLILLVSIFTRVFCNPFIFWLWVIDLIKSIKYTNKLANNSFQINPCLYTEFIYVKKWLELAKTHVCRLCMNYYVHTSVAFLLL